MEELVRALQGDWEALQSSMRAQVGETVPLAGRLASYVLASGGKRLRPLLTLACARLCHYQGHDHIPLAACVEFLHTATLLHDDVVDASPMRRGQRTASDIWGNQVAVLSGDFFLAKALQGMLSTRSFEVMGVFSETVLKLAEGELLQLEHHCDVSMGESLYMEIVRLKTSSLFSASCSVGGICAQCSSEQEGALRSFGDNLGVVFQITDDLLDYGEDTTEKAIGDDFLSGSVTLPLVLARACATDEEKHFWQEAFSEEGSRKDQGTFQKALEIMHRRKVFEKGRQIAKTYGQRAQEALSVFPDSSWKSHLGALVRHCVHRSA